MRLGKSHLPGNPKKLPGYCHPNKFVGAPDNLYLNLGGGRFQDLSKTVGKPVLATTSVAEYWPDDFNLEGSHVVRGVAEPVKVFALNA